MTYQPALKFDEIKTENDARKSEEQIQMLRSENQFLKQASE